MNLDDRKTEFAERILKKLHKRANKIFKSEDYDWEEKYDMIFCEELSRRVLKLAPRFEYHDPDTSYEQDVTAFVKQFNDYMDEQEESHPSDECEGMDKQELIAYLKKNLKVDILLDYSNTLTLKVKLSLENEMISEAEDQTWIP